MNSTRRHLIALGALRPNARPPLPPGDPSPQGWADETTLRLDVYAVRAIRRERAHQAS